MARWVASAVLACGAVAFGGCARRHAAIDPAVVAKNNEGVGLMRRYDFDGARKIFEPLAAAHPDIRDLRVNLAIATLNRQNEGDSADAEKLLDAVVSSDPNAIRAQYCLGLALLHDGRPSDALPHLKRAADASPRDGVAAYFVAQALSQSGQQAAALEWFDRATAIDPHLRSGYYGAFQMLQRLGRRAAADTRLARFKALETDPQSRLVEFKYTRMGPLSEATTIDQSPAPAPPPEPQGPVFDAPVPLAGATVPWRHFGPGDVASVTAADIDGDGRIDLFIAGGANRGRLGYGNAVLLNRGNGRFERDDTHRLAAIGGAEAALWGDVDNDGLVDVFLCRPDGNQLWRQHPAGVWTDVTRAARVPAGAGCVDGAMFDADHDGDLDILIVGPRGDDLLNNNGDGTFRSIAAQAGLSADTRPSRGLVLADLDGDRDADIVILKADASHEVLLNDRGWQYHRDPQYDSFEQATMYAAVAGDLDTDGNVELYTSDDQGIVRWTRGDHGWQSTRIDGTATLARARQLALVDVNGDGRPDIVGAGAGGGWSALTISGARATSVFSASTPSLSGWTTVVADDQHGPAMAAVPVGGDPVLWRPGSGRWPFATVALTGRDAGSDQLRSNVSGIGVALNARADSRWTTATTLRPQSGRGQGLQPIAFGLGALNEIDFVSLTWSDGVLQTELALGAGLHKIGEIERQLSSCPVLFAFDGRRFAFVTDLLGVGGMGTPSYTTAAGSRPAAPAPHIDDPRPHENLLLPEQAIAPRNGRFELRIDEPMEETAYVDATRLVAYDLPPGWQMVLDERKDLSAPAATGAPRFFRDEMLPERAYDDRRGDQTAALAVADGVAADPGLVDPRFIGRTAPHTLTLEFASPLDARSGNAMLVADGWIEYPYAQTVFAAWQAAAPYIAPTIQAQTASGEWVTLLTEFGYPAGMPRRMSVPLGPLPRGTRALRIRTTQEIYWDRLAVAFADEAPHVSRRELRLADARLAQSGFARRSVAAGRRPSYDYDRRAPLWDTRRQRGWYTAEGPITELVASEDGAVAIFGPGEEIQLAFDALSDAPPPGWTRRYVLEARGWCKDMDLYTKDGDTVEPLPSPAHPSSARDALNRKYNTRYLSGW